MKTKNVGAQEANTRKYGHLLGPKLDPKLVHFGQISETFCEHVCEDVSSSIFDGFWEASEPSFFDFRRGQKHNFHIFVKVFVGIVFDSQNPPKIRPNPPQEG